jgi:hypothetical protein
MLVKFTGLRRHCDLSVENVASHSDVAGDPTSANGLEPEVTALGSSIIWGSGDITQNSILTFRLTVLRLVSDNLFCISSLMSTMTADNNIRRRLALITGASGG